MNVRSWRQFDFSLGVQDATTWLLKKPNELQRGINLRFTEKVGGFQRRPGFVRAGEQFSTDNAPQGGHIAKFSNGSRRFVAVNNDAGTATIIRYQDSDTGEWEDLANLPAWPADSILFFLDYLNEVYVSGFDPVTGDPIQPVNINEDLDVSTTRNLLNCPSGYFFAEYLGILYIANVTANGERHKDRVYKSSPPLGAVTYVQGDQQDVLTEATFVDNVPVMTSNTAPSGVVSASTVYSSTYEPFNVFDNNTARSGGSWFTSQGVVTGWIRYDFGAGNAKAITHYSMVAISSNPNTSLDPAGAPKNWQFQGSNDGSTWTTLHSVTNAPTWGTQERRYFTTTNTTAYRYYRLNITANNGGTNWVTLNDWELLTALEGTRSIVVKLDSVRYIKDGMDLNIYRKGTNTKLFDINVTSVNKAENTITFAPYSLDFTGTNVNTTTNAITLADTTKFTTGTTVKLASSNTVPAGLAADTTYYAIWIDATTIKLAASLDQALLGQEIDITSVGSGTHNIRLSYALEDNDEIWLDGTKDKLNIFWNTDYPTPQATGEFLHIKPGTDAAATISGIKASANRLFIFTKNSGTRYDGQNLVVFNHSIGCISHRSLANIDDDWLIWVDAKGNVRARSENMGGQENISRAIRNPIMRRLDQEQLKAVSAGVVDQVYKLYLGSIDDQYMRVCYDFEANTWSPEVMGYPALIQAMDDHTGELKPYFFSNNGRLYMDETGDLDDDKTIPFTAGTGPDMFGSEQTKKFVGLLLFTRKCNGLRLQVAVDGGQMQTVGRIEGTVCYIPFPENGDNVIPRGVALDWQIVGNMKGEAPEVEGAVIYYSPEETYPHAK